MYKSITSYVHFHNSKRLTEQDVAEADRHSLGLNVVLQSSLTQLPANARLLIPSEWESEMESVVGVDPDSSSAECVGNLEGGVEVGGVNSGGQTVGRVVANLDDIGLRLELGDCADRAKDLLLLNLHVLGNI